MALVKDPSNIRLAMIGMVDGNGHPYSWSAIINGDYNRDTLAESEYPAILNYLEPQPKEALGIDGATVTHLFCDDMKDALHVAKAAKLANVVEKPEDVIGHVDAVVIATDKGWEHLDRAKPFVEAGLPLFIDKPMTDQEDHLRQFVKWQREGKAILSTSAMRYAREYVALRDRMGEVGELRLISNTTPKSWERYGIHALEGVYPFLAPGEWRSVTNSGSETANMVHIEHASGANVFLAAIKDMYGGFGYLNLHGTKGSLQTVTKDTFYSFKTQLVSFVDYLRTGELPFPFEETVELMKIIIAGIRSREESGKKIYLSDIKVD